MLLYDYDFTGKKILIAEDEDTNFMFLKALFRKTNAELIWVKTGLMAIEAIRNDSDIRLILMDMRMPDMDGLTASIEIKRTNPNIVIIAQTAYALSNEREKILAAGCDNYVSKPISGQALLEMVNGYLNH